MARELLGLALTGSVAGSRRSVELEAHRTLTGSSEHLAVLADCYRALHKYGQVAEVWEELKAASPSAALVAEGRIVMAGALADQGKLRDALEGTGAGRDDAAADPGAPHPHVVRARRSVRPLRRDDPRARRSSSGSRTPPRATPTSRIASPASVAEPASGAVAGVPLTLAHPRRTLVELLPPRRDSLTAKGGVMNVVLLEGVLVAAVPAYGELPSGSVLCTLEVTTRDAARRRAVGAGHLVRSARASAEWDAGTPSRRVRHRAAPVLPGRGDHPEPDRGRRPSSWPRSANGAGPVESRERARRAVETSVS